MTQTKYALIFFLGLAYIYSTAQNQSYDTIQYAREHHLKRLSSFKKEPIIKNKIIFLGNSITEFGNWKELLNDTTIINRGIAGDNTFGVLLRLDEIINMKPSKLFIEIGINDISQNIPSEIIRKNILSIADKVHTRLPLTKIYIISILPTNDNAKYNYPNAYNKNNIAISINNFLIESEIKSGFVYVNLFEKIQDKNGKLDTRYAQPDGIHLNQSGYNIWVDLLRSKKYI